MPATCDVTTPVRAAKAVHLAAITKEEEEKAEELRMLQEIRLESVKPFAAVYAKLEESKAARPAHPIVSEEDKMEMDSRSVFVKNVNYGSTAEALGKHFLGCGEIKRITIPTTANGRQKGLAFIEFADEAGKDNGLVMSGSVFNGRVISVEPKRTNVRGFGQVVKVVQMVHRPHRNRQVLFNNHKVINRSRPY